LLGRTERKNGWQLAEAAGDATPYGLQQFLYRAIWDPDAVRDDLRAYVVAHLGGPQGILVVLPSDHHVADVAGFKRTISEAAQVAAKGHLVTLGIKPNRPETGYGYIQVGDALEGGSRRVKAFREKPDVETARRYVESGEFLWNAGIFAWRRDTVRNGLLRHAPHIAEPLRDGLSAGRPLGEIYPPVPSTSIDYALLEPASVDGAVAVVPTDAGWSDVGSWAALLDARADEGGPDRVVTDGETIDEGSRDVLVHSGGGRLVVTIGLSGTIVVDTPDVVLVCSREHAQDVKRVVDALVAAKESDHL